MSSPTNHTIRRDHPTVSVITNSILLISSSRAPAIVVPRWPSTVGSLTFALLSHNVVSFIDEMNSGDVLRRVLLSAFMRGMRIDEAAALFRVPKRTLRSIRQDAAALPRSLRDALAMECGSRTRRRMCSAEQQALERWFRSVLPVHSGDVQTTASQSWQQCVFVAHGVVLSGCGAARALNLVYRAVRE
jgi:hypothetical protein